jgi:hypothetical protein
MNFKRQIYDFFFCVPLKNHIQIKGREKKIKSLLEVKLMYYKSVICLKKIEMMSCGMVMLLLVDYALSIYLFFLQQM